MATEEKESDKKTKRGSKPGAKGGKKPVAREKKEKQSQNTSEAAEVKPKAAPKPKKGKKEDAPAAEGPKQKKKGRPPVKKTAKGAPKQPDTAEQQPAEKPAASKAGRKAKTGRKGKAVTPEVTAADIPLAGNENEVAPAKAPQGGRVKKKRGSGKKRGGQKPAPPQKEEEAIKGKAPADQAREAEKADAPASDATIEEAPQEVATAPVKEAPAPRKKKGRPKKAGKKTEEAPPPPVAEEPIQVQENKVVIGSRNPAKIKAVEMAYGRLFPDETFIFESVAVPLGVSEQPMSDDETFAGALFRAQTAREEVQDAGYYVGLEGGIEEIGDELQAFGWMVVLSHDSKIGKARTSTFVLPYAVAEMIRDGKELGEADDVVFGKTNSKLDQGAVGILTHGLIDRAHYYAEAVIMALIPFKNPEYYSAESLETV